MSMTKWKPRMSSIMGRRQLPLRPYVRVRLNNGYTYMGYLAGYTQQIDTAGRELILEQPLRVTPPSGEKKPLPVGQNWQHIVFRQEDISTLAVRYDPPK